MRFNPIRDLISSPCAMQMLANQMSIHDALCKYIPTMLRPAHADSATTQSLLTHLWFFTELVAASLARTVLVAREKKVNECGEAKQFRFVGARSRAVHTRTTLSHGKSRSDTGAASDYKAA